MPVFKGKQRPEPEFFISGFSERFRMYRRGDWKLVKVNNRDWELYNILEDATELNDLAKQKPEKVKELEKLYREYMASLP